jgi:hypothetical protein
MALGVRRQERSENVAHQRCFKPKWKYLIDPAGRAQRSIRTMQMVQRDKTVELNSLNRSIWLAHEMGKVIDQVVGRGSDENCL